MSLWKLPEDITPAQRRENFSSGVRKSNHASFCFGCQNPDGLNISVYYSDELWVKGTFKVTAAMQGGPGVIHGGLAITALDEVMGCATRLVTPYSVTGHLQSDFKKPVSVDQELTIIARVIGVVRRKIYVEAQLYGTDLDTVLINAHAIFIQIDPVAHYKEHVERLNA